jgi:hypothetical protein
MPAVDALALLSLFEAILEDHPLMPVPLVLYAILRQIADIGKEPDNRVPARGRLVEK